MNSLFSNMKTQIRTFSSFLQRNPQVKARVEKGSISAAEYIKLVREDAILNNFQEFTKLKDDLKNKMLEEFRKTPQAAAK